MDSMGIDLGNLNHTTFNASIKNKENNEPTEETPVNTENNDLNSPMETVGRSMVNFKSAAKPSLSSADLNYMATKLSNMNFTSEELKVVKDSMLKTIEQYKASSWSDLVYDLSKSKDPCALADLGQDFLNNLQQLHPKADLERYEYFALKLI